MQPPLASTCQIRSHVHVLMVSNGYVRQMARCNTGYIFILLISYCCYNIWKKARLVITNLDLHILYVEVHCVKHNVDGHVCGSSARARSGLSSEAPYTYMTCSAVIVDIFIIYTVLANGIKQFFLQHAHTHTPKKMRMRITR